MYGVPLVDSWLGLVALLHVHVLQLPGALSGMQFATVKYWMKTTGGNLVSFVESIEDLI